MAFESTPAAVAAGNMANGVALTDTDRARLGRVKLPSPWEWQPPSPSADAGRMGQADIPEGKISNSLISLKKA
jgi:hypothetical protein